MGYSYKILASGGTIADRDVRQFMIDSMLEVATRDEILSEIIHGLQSGQKYISSRFFYDERGSSLFERITNLPEYYPTRTEKSILRMVAPEVTAGSAVIDLVELGSGDCSKISILLDAIPGERIPGTRYYPIDISEWAIVRSARILAGMYPELQVRGILADFMKHLDSLPGQDKRLICFFGSTIGNLTREQAIGFLAGIRENMLQGDSLLLGLDMVKETAVLEAAYNDAKGITETFNRNILYVVNGIAGTGFHPESFRHVAFYNHHEQRIDMHLEAMNEMEVGSPHFAVPLKIMKGETIHTENSHKFTPGDIDQLADRSGLEVKKIHTDPNGWFSLVHFNK